MKLIDTHSHIYLKDFDPDRPYMMENAEKVGVAKILMPAIDSVTHSEMLEAEAFSGGLSLSMMGLHPCSVKENYLAELDLARDHLEKRKFVAIGETGLDFYWDLTFKEQQYYAFQQQIEWALEFEIPVVIHSRNSTDECIDMISQNQKGSLKGVFHCFSGSDEQARQVIDLGFYLGIGGVITFKNSGLDKVMKNIDLRYVVLETDAPYLAPVPYRGKRNEPSYIKYVAEKLADVKGKPPAEIASITTANAQKLFGL
ncbi:MAG: TatD family hydrolase [Chitinophagaceae bacterium]|nr:TatD family hydrolase [Chitinophagaceae bacterium]